MALRCPPPASKKKISTVTRRPVGAALFRVFTTRLLSSLAHEYGARLNASRKLRPFLKAKPNCRFVTQGSATPQHCNPANIKLLDLIYQRITELDRLISESERKLDAAQEGMKLRVLMSSLRSLRYYKSDEVYPRSRRI